MAERTTTVHPGQNYRVPAHIVAWAKREATKRCKATGKPVNWSHIIREVLETAAAIDP